MARNFHGERNPNYSHGARTGGKVCPEYTAWAHMRRRCTDTNYKYYHRYGGRGIKVCPQWDNFDVFFRDMGKKPNKKYSLDRIDNDGNYEPGNCRWATQKQQVNNSSRVLRINAFGETLKSEEWAERYGVPNKTIVNRLRKGWSAERAVSTPLKTLRSPRRSGNEWGNVPVGGCITVPTCGTTAKGECRARVRLRMSVYFYNRRHGTSIVVGFDYSHPDTLRCTRLS